MQNKKPNRLMQVFELENDFARHREKIMKVKKRNAAKEMKKAHHSQMDIINTFRKNWVKASTFKVN